MFRTGGSDRDQGQGPARTAMLSPGGLSTLYSSRIETYLGLMNNMPFPWVDIRCGPNPAAYAEHIHGSNLIMLHSRSLIDDLN